MKFEFEGEVSEDNEYDAYVIHGDEISIFDYHQRYHPENSHLKIDKKYRVKISIEEVTRL